ncbi:MAG: CDP-alcohol phosphatidyltransferase family protein [Planctomycetota bacterium]
MVSIYELKPAFQGLLRPVTTRLAKAGVTANQVTIAAVLLSFAGGAAVFMGHEQRLPLLAVPLVLFVRMALNAIDGMLAREHNMKSRLGAILNELGDVVSDAALYLPYALIAGVSATLVIVVVFLAALVEMIGVVAIQIGAERRYDGPLGKSDRAFFFGAIALLLGAGWLPVRFVDPLLGLALALSVWTVIRRAKRALAEPLTES